MRIPLATYRVQLNEEFTFDDASGIVDYLHELGISDLYASPVLQARSGSTHGYDVVDAGRISAGLGGRAGFDRLSVRLSQCGMGLLLDIVPNHMAASPENSWWLDVLSNGKQSRYARYFDIDWESPRPGLRGRVLLPILGDHIGAVLDRGELAVERADDGDWVRYYDWRLQVSESPESQAALAAHRQALEQGDDGARAETLDRLLERQHYRLAYWRLANQEINYRRFFDITDLVSLRIEDPAVFDDVHRLALELVSDGAVSGLRIDHIDGLHDPRAYLDRLHAEAARAAGEPFYIVAEKILVGDEELADDWPAAGTTGYDFLNQVNGVMADGRAAERLNALYRWLTGSEQEFHALVRRAKHFVIEQLFAGDLQRLGLMLWRIADADRYGRDLSLIDLRAAIAELTACFPVYRSYTSDGTVHADDETRILAAADVAREHCPDLIDAIAFLRRVSLLGDPAPEQRDSWLAFIQRWQQFSGPVMAKGLEDTSLYIDTRLISMNAVGGEPEIIEISVAEFHRWVGRRADRWPHAMNASSTHDSKRSEDVRARISVLSELLDEWEIRVPLWRSLNEGARVTVHGQPAPGPRMELLLYQTMLGAWPFDETELDSFRERLKAYAIKAAREAKLDTSWIDESPEYEAALLGFIDAIMEDSAANEFLADFRSFVPRITWHGALNSLSQTLLKITAPGLPDFYRGTELWDLSLVDPDNRRSVDYERCRAALDRVRSIVPDEAVSLFDEWTTGDIKLYVIQRALHARRERRSLFDHGEYVPLQVDGSRARHVIAFARQTPEDSAVVIVPRLTAELVRPAGRIGTALPVGDEVWGDTRVRLPDGAPGEWRNQLTNQVAKSEGQWLRLRNVLSEFPLALLFPR